MLKTTRLSLNSIKLRQPSRQVLHHTRHLHTPSQALQGKRCLITGGTSGIGFSIAHEFTRAGASSIGIVGRDNLRIHDAFHELQAIPGSEETEFVAVVGDVGKETPDIAKYGSFDILVNAAGITHQSLLLSTNDEVVHQVLDTNLLGTIMMSKAFVKHVTRSRMKSQRSATEGSSVASDSCIINISSLLGVKSGRGSSVYAASKAGVIAFSRALASECGAKAAGEPAIRVNTIVPGYIETAMTKAYSPGAREKISESIPLRRFGSASEVANAALFLATNSYAHNCVLNIDGGLSAS